MAELLFLLGSVVAGCLWVHRWRQVRHLPLQNMCELFLSMAMWRL